MKRTDTSLAKTNFSKTKVIHTLSLQKQQKYFDH